MEQGPVLLIQFHAHQIECWRDFKQEVVVGSPVSQAFTLHLRRYLCTFKTFIDSNLSNFYVANFP